MKDIELITLKNSHGLVANITNLGGRIQSLIVPDRDGRMQDVVLGFEHPEDYLPENHLSDFGATIGRYANRIGNGRFTLDGKTYQLPQNNGRHCLHGGPDGWQYKVFDIVERTDNSLTLSLVSPDGDNQFPGEVHLTVRFTLTDEDGLRIDYKATSDAPTVVNLTNHSYFNLNGDHNTDILNHLLTINADRFTCNDDTCLPTGEIRSVEGTPMDFRTAKAIGRDIETDDEQLRNGCGYDHNFILDHSESMTLAATLESPVTGIRMQVLTDQPGMQIYTGNFLDGSVIGKYGKCYRRRNAVCLETQHYPDSPNHPEWKESNAVLRPGEEFTTTTEFRFCNK